MGLHVSPTHPLGTTKNPLAGRRTHLRSLAQCQRSHVRRFHKENFPQKNLLHFKEFGDNMMERCYPGRLCGALYPFNKANLMEEQMKIVLLLILGLIPIRDNGMMKIVRIQSTSSVRKTPEQQNHFNSFQNYVFLFLFYILHDNYRSFLYIIEEFLFGSFTVH